MLRSHTCGELTRDHLNEEVVLSGWVHGRRDHGGIIFIDIRDRYGITQLKFDPKTSRNAWNQADNVRSEWVIGVKGHVMARPDDMINPKISTGEIEIDCAGITVYNESKTPPFDLHEERGNEANEELRLRYRYIDLRRPKVQEMLRIRDETIRYIRSYFHKHDFIEVQTPILTGSSPEGARDFLVPSRLYPGQFYALPQAPQQFKQLLMVGGLDRYFQIAPCFRDEDSRNDRHYGEFYQLDMEMSFVQQEDIFDIMEPLMVELTEKFSEKKVLWHPFPKISWRDAMNRYGTDKPDLRFGFEIKPVTELLTGCGFKVFAECAGCDGKAVHALRIEGGSTFSRKQIESLTDTAVENGAKGLAYMVLKSENKIQSPIVKFLGEELASKIITAVGAKQGEIIFFVADKWRIVCRALGAVRDKCGYLLNLKDNNKAAWLWVTDFPMYDYSELEEGRIDFSHNPFSMPQGGLDALENQNPLDIVAYQFDFILNGYELTSGAIRNHDPKIMYKAFEIAGYSKEEVDAGFGHMIKAFEYGAPPHGGNAPGIDRLLMVLNDWNSIRDIYAFPKDGKGKDLMMNAPNSVNNKQLLELGIKSCTA